jgi:phosphoglycolate phosphatase
MNRLALFDCDGTLVDSQASICMAMEATFAAAKLVAPSRYQIRRIVGLSLYEAMRHLLPDAQEAQHRELVELYRAQFLALRGNGLVEEPLYDGMADLLAKLSADAWMLGVATGKSDRGLERVLTQHGVKDLFVTLQTADRHPSKPHPSMIHQSMADAGSDLAKTIMIGDTIYDIEMAVAAGCQSIGVAWGYHPIDELRAAGADRIAENMDELAAYLRDMI